MTGQKLARAVGTVTEVTIYTPDRHGLVSLLAGAIAGAGGNIVDARIFTLTNGMALDTFWVQDAEGGPFERRVPVSDRPWSHWLLAAS